MLELRNVSKTYGPTRALVATDLLIEPQRTTVIIGPSGSGKSTILRMMIGLVSTDTGWVEFEGARLLPENILQLRQRMGYVIQEGGLFPHLTARRNVQIMAGYLGWSSERMEARLSELITLTRFPAEGLDRFPAQLSGGQRQRLSLMRALMLDPHMLLMDEPLGALDPMIRSELQSDLLEIFQGLKKTVVMVTHDLAEASFFGDVIVLMREGRIVQQGTFMDLIEDPADEFVTRFVNAQRKTLDVVRNKEK